MLDTNNTSLYDFKSEIVSSSNKPPAENIDVFRHEYPHHVIVVRKCLEEILKNPEKESISIILFYGIDVDKFKQITKLEKFDKKSILKHKERIQYE